MTFAAPIAAEDWPQIGGPNRNFSAPTVSLAGSWPETGPKLVWQAKSTMAHAGIVIASNRAFDFSHRNGIDMLTARDASTGDVVWQQSYPESFEGGGYGPGPLATPLVVNGIVFTISAQGKLTAFKADKGAELWKRDLNQLYNVNMPDIIWHGYAACPLAYENLIIVPVGGSGGNAVVAFEQKTGEVVWHVGTMRLSYASPLLLERDAEKAAVVFAKDKTLFIDPVSGRLQNEIPHGGSLVENVGVLPLWSANKDLLWTSARGWKNPQTDGTRVFSLKSGANASKIAWRAVEQQVESLANAVLIEDVLYTTLGNGRRVRLSAIDLHSGTILWQEKGFYPTKILITGDKSLMLDERGKLSLARISRAGFQQLASHQLQSRRTWAMPALSGTRLFVRDGRTVKAFEIGQPESAGPAGRESAN